MTSSWLQLMVPMKSLRVNASIKWVIILIIRSHNLTIALSCHIHLVSRVAYTFIRSLSVHTFRIGSTGPYVCPVALVDVIWTVITLPTRLKITINTQNTMGFRQRRVNICNPKSPKAKGTSWTTMVSLQLARERLTVLLRQVQGHPHVKPWMLSQQQPNTTKQDCEHISHGLVQGRRNSSVLAMELCLSCNNPSIFGGIYFNR